MVATIDIIVMAPVLKLYLNMCCSLVLLCHIIHGFGMDSDVKVATFFIIPGMSFSSRLYSTTTTRILCMYDSVSVCVCL